MKRVGVDLIGELKRFFVGSTQACFDRTMDKFSTDLGNFSCELGSLFCRFAKRLGQMVRVLVAGIGEKLEGVSGGTFESCFGGDLFERAERFFDRVRSVPVSIARRGEGKAQRLL